MKKYFLILLLTVGFLPASVLALSSPVVDPPPAVVSDSVYTLTIHVPAGSTVSVVGGPSDLAPVTDGADGDALDGVVKVMVGLAPNQVNPFSIIDSLNGVFSDSITVNITQGSGGVTSEGNAAPPVTPAPQVETTVTKLEPKTQEAPAVIPFTDIQNHWAAPYIEKLYTMGVVSGKSATRFDPNAAVTRAEMAKIVVKIFGYTVPETVAEDPFWDVPKESWFAPYVAAAKENAITGGYPDGSFKPGALVDRASALKMLIVAAGFAEGIPETSAFSDVQVSDWYAGFIDFAHKNDIVGGYADNTFKPGNPVTRAEVMKMAVKLYELKKGK